MCKIELRNLDKVYTTGKVEYQALKNINLTIGGGQVTAIVGPSGSGKSTILNMITGIDRPTSGSVIVDGTRIDTMSENELARWRGKNVGIIFQFFQLFPTLTALENAMLPMDLARMGSNSERRMMAMKNLTLVGLGDKMNNLPSALSGGEQQRVAIARALACDPKIIIGDEPTGNLDSQTEAAMFELLKKLNDQGKTIIYVTHSKDLAARAMRRITIRDGQVQNT
ncbi:MAG: ABC transporter ATP-binding protein [Candidatus Thermoplasmatota archaeon]|nr:ABC transporter ATP-binding protein [Candidatus Thermoplasmatota archaeon]